MSILSTYLNKHSVFPELIRESPDKNLNIIIVVPAFNEKDVVISLRSIFDCKLPEFPVEVIVMINAAENSPIEIKKRNEKSFEEVNSFFAKKNHSLIKGYAVLNNEFPAKTAGVGLARKTGMDEAIRRFNALNHENGIIASFDADSTCDNNYLIEIERLFRENKKLNACNIYFEHPISGNEFDKKVYEAAKQYELFLRYYKRALQSTGFPYHYYTIGSCFCVKASAYSKQGGMNRRQAGEDFYFLQKIFALGNFKTLNSTRIIPSSRPSQRVPFGTGKSIQQFISGSAHSINVYHPKAFVSLKELFDCVTLLYKASEAMIESTVHRLQPHVTEFLVQNFYLENIKEISENSSDLLHFTKRFYAWFNAFKVLKYLNFAHSQSFNAIPVQEAAGMILKWNNENIALHTVDELLAYYRTNDRNEKLNPSF